MKFLAIGATLATAAAFATSSPAFAQQTFGGTLFNVSDVDAPYTSAYGMLPPYEVLTIVRSMGFETQGRPMLRGRVYIVHAIDNQDIPVRVAVDAASGRVVRVVERMPGAGYGSLPPDRYGAYPVPQAPVPGGTIYEESDGRAPDYRSPDYRAPEYRQPNAYPRPIYPQSSTQRPAAQSPRVAARNPSATPTPKTRPPQAAPAPQATNPQPQGSTTQPAATSSLENNGRPGVSIPAPVAARKIATPPEEPAAKPATPAPSDTAKPADPALVPVAPLE